MLQLLLVCLAATGELLSACAESLQHLASPAMSKEERKLVTEAEEFKSLLQGLNCLRRLHWRFGLSAELFLPSCGSNEVAESGEECERLLRLHAGATSRLAESKAAWSRVEAELRELH